MVKICFLILKMQNIDFLTSLKIGSKFKSVNNADNCFMSNVSDIKNKNKNY